MIRSNVDKEEFVKLIAQGRRVRCVRFVTADPRDREGKIVMWPVVKISYRCNDGETEIRRLEVFEADEQGNIDLSSSLWASYRSAMDLAVRTNSF